MLRFLKLKSLGGALGLVQKRKKFFYGAGVLGLLAVLYFYKSIFVAAVVNGYPITRIELMRELEKQAGREALDTVVSKRLVEQEAKKKMIKVTSSDVDLEIEKIKAQLASQGQELDTVLALQGIDPSELEDRIRFQLILTKLVGDVSVSGEEVDSYLEENREFLGEDADSQEGRAAVEEQLAAQKQGQLIQELLERLQEEAKINYFLSF